MTSICTGLAGGRVGLLAIFLGSIIDELPGIFIQLILIPALVRYLRHAVCDNAS